MVTVLIILMVVCLVSALLAISSFMSSVSGGAQRTTYWSKIFGGVAYLSLATMGLLATPYLPETSSHLWPNVLSIAFGLIGGWLLATGLKLRRASRP